MRFLSSCNNSITFYLYRTYVVYAGGGTTHDLATLWCWNTTPPDDTFYWMG
jgi:hypothetical protein